MQEVFDFVECADPEHKILWNIESKINPQYPNRTLGVEDFVKRQHALFSASPYASQITVCCIRFVSMANLSLNYSSVPEFRLANTPSHEGNKHWWWCMHSLLIYVQTLDPKIPISALIDEYVTMLYPNFGCSLLVNGCLQ